MHGKHYGLLCDQVTLVHMPHGPLLASISKGPKILGDNLPHLPKLNELHFDFTFK